ncbi:hypothetical protein BH20ACT6_BH20ACT6_05540 [soil metagenome]
MGPARSTDHGTCPTWCTATHGTFGGEEDDLHTSAPVRLTDELVVYVCAYVDPFTGQTDGPHIFANADQWSPERARAIGAGLVALADVVDEPALTPPATGRTLPVDP